MTEDKGFTTSETAKREEETLKKWQEAGIFEKTLAKDSPEGEFVFYDGPPFATGLPHYGSLLSSIVKDVIPRYKTMRGFHVRRRWGWDCHGLPIESQIEKQLGLKTKKDIEAIGIEAFNEACRASVLRYTHDWKVFVDRVGRWVEFENAYKTMDNSYIESVWWALKELHGKKLLYEGKKVLMYCPHCETPLAKAEIAMDNTYQDVTEEAVTVKFKVKNPAQWNLPENTFILAWTTTPWTLPGNVALAVGEDIEYVVVQTEGASLIVAKILAEKVFDGKEYKILGEVSGADLAGVEYEPLYEIEALATHAGKKYCVVPADFVTTEEGTGVVHTAVMYGEDDFILGQKEELPMVQLLDASGRYNTDAPQFLQGEYIKDAESSIKKDLDKRGLLFAKKNNTHSYPHCYRCNTPLIYNAITSWFVDIQENKKKMLKLNEDIEWVPEHLKEGRFKNIVEGAPDWTVSRNRYWASPLPIWKCDTCDEMKVVGSIKDLLSSQKKSGNRYIVMRHGEAVSNEKGVLCSTANHENDTLTEKGKEEVRIATDTRLKGEEIDMIFVSPFARTRETADIVAEQLGVSDVIVSEALAEIGGGVMDGKPIKEWIEFFRGEGWYERKAEGSESHAEVALRVAQFIFEIEENPAYSGKNILIITHGAVAQMLSAVVNRPHESSSDAHLEKFQKTTEIHELPFVPYPHTADFAFDLHRPYIDRVTLACACGGSMHRIPEVIDCWLESGAMPFAEYNYPFNNKKEFESRFPGDFVAEYVAQTRTWFYYMHALGTALFGDRPFKNVVSTGTVLAEDGSKMSKSKGNYSDPMEIMSEYGADALRYYLMTSVVMQGEDLRFTNNDVKDAHNKVVNILRNVVSFYELYADNAVVPNSESEQVLDIWIRARLAETLTEVTEGLEKYDTVRGGRPLRAFVEDLSTWYVRRSRDRFKSGDEADAKAALGTLRYVLLETAKMIAPLMPFLAEHVYVSAGGEKESVHLEEWPTFAKASAGEDNVLSEMESVRKTVSLALEARMNAKQKIRQPLAKLTVRGAGKALVSNSSYAELIKDEVNVKEVVFDSEGSGWEVELDTDITPELKKEGDLRELIRSIQAFRKQSNLSAGEEVALTITTDAEGRALVEEFKDEIISATTLSALDVSEDGKEGEWGFEIV